MRIYSIENEFIKVDFLTKGATIVSIVKKENQSEYILSYKDMEDYTHNEYYLGATAGRNAGRTFPTEYVDYYGKVKKLLPNENRVYLHGGEHGYSTVEWNLIIKQDDFAILEYVDRDSDYVEATIFIIYELIDNNFVIRYLASSEIPTIFNLTNHSYFNLNQQEEATIEGHYLKIDNSELQLVGDEFVPTGEYSDMKEQYNNFNFAEFKKIKEAFNGNNDLGEKCKGGIDLAYCFKNIDVKNPKIELWSENKENGLQIFTNQESCVVYTLNKLSKNILDFNQYQGITFEMQRRPNYIHLLNSEYLEKNYYNYIRYKIL